MTPNIGGGDRALRIAIGILLLVLTKLGHIGVWGYIGLLPVATGLFKFCPIYRLFGLNTCPVKK